MIAVVPLPQCAVLTFRSAGEGIWHGVVSSGYFVPGSCRLKQLLYRQDAKMLIQEML
jgi:hypothetical protein